jgi:chloramphenicol 3-O phosphotransferase
MDRDLRGNAGTIILLNGASSSGKSTLARMLQAKMDRPFWHVSIDHLRDAGVLPLDRIKKGDFEWAAMREAFFEGYHRSLAAYAQAGNHLIVEHIVETNAWLQRMVALSEPYDVFFVGLHCPLDELERRERRRGDRALGDARRDFSCVHDHALYDLELDSTQSAQRNAERLISCWHARTRPSGFEQLAVRFRTQRDVETPR